MKYRILIVEDNIMLAGQQKKRLEKSGYEAEITIDEPGARKLLKKESFDLVLSDVRLPEGDGISLLEWMRKERMDIPFIIMTGYASVPDAVQAIKLGAKDYLAKPVQMDELQRQLKDIFRPKSVICDKNKDLLPRNSLQMQEVEHLVSTVAPFDISVLILGPNGAGKESVAQRIHYIGERKDMPFVAVNCGVIPKELAPSLFFGHIKGTFTGADANKDGYFEVAKDPSKPFQVEMNGASITVLGTHFNVKADAESDDITATLVEGSIRFEGAKQNIVMTPNQQLTFNRSTNKVDVKEIDTDTFTAWKDGLLKYKSIPFTELIENLKDIYQVEIRIDDERLADPSITVSGTFNQKQSIEQILKVISHSLPIRWTNKTGNYHIQHAH